MASSPFPLPQQTVDDPFQHRLLDVLRLNARTHKEKLLEIHYGVMVDETDDAWWDPHTRPGCDKWACAYCAEQSVINGVDKLGVDS